MANVIGLISNNQKSAENASRRGFSFGVILLLASTLSSVVLAKEVVGDEQELHDQVNEPSRSELIRQSQIYIENGMITVTSKLGMFQMDRLTGKVVLLTRQNQRYETTLSPKLARGNGLFLKEGFYWLNNSVGSGALAEAINANRGQLNKHGGRCENLNRESQEAFWSAVSVCQSSGFVLQSCDGAIERAAIAANALEDCLATDAG